MVIRSTKTVIPSIIMGIPSTIIVIPSLKMVILSPTMVIMRPKVAILSIKMVMGLTRLHQLSLGNKTKQANNIERLNQVLEGGIKI